MNRAVIVIIALLVVGIGAWAVRSSSGGSGDAALMPVAFEGLDDPATRATAITDRARPAIQGNPNARIKIIEFGDYGCPACAGFYASIKPQIDLAYGDADDVAFTFYDLPGSTQNSFVASRAAWCAGDQGAYWEYHGALFDNQDGWRLSPSAPLGQLESYAANLGLDQGEFSSCLRSDAHAELVTANLELARSLGVGTTPTIMLSDGSGQGARLQSSFAAIQAAVEAARGAAAGGETQGSDDESGS